LVRVVAIGSSSTAGNGASAPGNGYVEVTQNLLAHRTELATFIVINAGVAGNSLADIQARLQHDALSLAPQLVILQVGVNDALTQPSQAGVEAFQASLADTVSQIKAVAPVLIVTGQYFPSQPAFYESYMVAMLQVGSQQHVAVFDRYYLMKNAIASGQYSFASLLAADNFHPNDVMHRCTGQVLADLIASKVQR
jgi:lysophospholipase L1-like esterase